MAELKEQLQHDYEQLYPGLSEIIRIVLERLDDMMGIVGCGFGTYTRQYE